MTTRRAAVFWFFFGLVLGVIFYAIYQPVPVPTDVDKVWSALTGKACENLQIGQCLQDIANQLTPLMAYGAILGLIGLAMQLFLRGEWPTGQINEGRPKILDPTALVTAGVAAALAGIVAAAFLAGTMRVPATIAFSYLAADLATLGTDMVAKLWGWVKAQFQKLVGAK